MRSILESLSEIRSRFYILNSIKNNSNSTRLHVDVKTPEPRSYKIFFITRRDQNLFCRIWEKGRFILGFGTYIVLFVSILVRLSTFFLCLTDPWSFQFLVVSLDFRGLVGRPPSSTGSIHEEGDILRGPFWFVFVSVVVRRAPSWETGGTRTVEDGGLNHYGPVGYLREKWECPSCSSLTHCWGSRDPSGSVSFIKDEDVRTVESRRWVTMIYISSWFTFNTLNFEVIDFIYFFKWSSRVIRLYTLSPFFYSLELLSCYLSLWTPRLCFLSCQYSNLRIYLFSFSSRLLYKYFYWFLKGINDFLFGRLNSSMLLWFILFGFLSVWFCVVFILRLLTSVFILTLSIPFFSFKLQ